VALQELKVRDAVKDGTTVFFDAKKDMRVLLVGNRMDKKLP
jgi:hypothetical protein